MDTVLMQKEVDKSVLYQGMSIPKVYQKLFMDKLGVAIFESGWYKNNGLFRENEKY